MLLDLPGAADFTGVGQLHPRHLLGQPAHHVPAHLCPTNLLLLAHLWLRLISQIFPPFDGWNWKLLNAHCRPFGVPALHWRAMSSAFNGDLHCLWEEPRIESCQSHFGPETGSLNFKFGDNITTLFFSSVSWIFNGSMFTSLGSGSNSSHSSSES